MKGKGRGRGTELVEQLREDKGKIRKKEGDLI
jgi:hypothetical protein